ncbi:hypothetical protein K0M31_003269 [Melipona bicolor]|uniref:Uncharacterized protein n=1 Tax=Melipona bicolor TaxID=60889 RepID=A0AA40FYP0_9HYME|nr:hypothetical protein K0M31_003269 [Melipona bicolor]
MPGNVSHSRSNSLRLGEPLLEGRENFVCTRSSYANVQYVVDRSMITMYTKVYNNVTCGDAIEHARSLQRDPRHGSLSTYIQFPILSPSFALGRLCPLRFSMTVMAVSLGKVKDAPKVEEGHRYSERAFRRIDFR